MHVSVIMATKVTTVRNLQKLYFKASAKAKKSRNPDDFKEARELLEQSKKEEKELDALCAAILGDDQKKLHFLSS